MEKKNIKTHIEKYKPSWKSLYKRFGIKRVNYHIEKLNIYSGMDGKPKVLK